MKPVEKCLQVIRNINVKTYAISFLFRFSHPPHDDDVSDQELPPRHRGLSDQRAGATRGHGLRLSGEACQYTQMWA